MKLTKSIMSYVSFAMVVIFMASTICVPLAQARGRFKGRSSNVIPQGSETPNMTAAESERRSIETPLGKHLEGVASWLNKVANNESLSDELRALASTCLEGMVGFLEKVMDSKNPFVSQKLKTDARNLREKILNEYLDSTPSAGQEFADDWADSLENDGNTVIGSTVTEYDGEGGFKVEMEYTDALGNVHTDSQVINEDGFVTEKTMVTEYPNERISKVVETYEERDGQNLLIERTVERNFGEYFEPSHREEVTVYQYEQINGEWLMISAETFGEEFNQDGTSLRKFSQTNFLYDLNGELVGGSHSATISGEVVDANGETTYIDIETVSTEVAVIDGGLYVVASVTNIDNYRENGNPGELERISTNKIKTELTYGWVGGKLTVTGSKDTILTQEVDQSGEYTGSYSVQINTKTNEYDAAGNLVNIRHGSEGASFTKGKDGQGDTFQVLAPTVYYGPLATGEEPDADLADSSDTFYIYTTTQDGGLVLKVLHETWFGTDGDVSGLLAEYSPEKFI